MMPINVATPNHPVLFTIAEFATSYFGISLRIFTINIFRTKLNQVYQLYALSILVAPHNSGDCIAIRPYLSTAYCIYAGN